MFRTGWAREDPLRVTTSACTMWRPASSWGRRWTASPPGPTSGRCVCPGDDDDDDDIDDGDYDDDDDGVSAQGGREY